MTAPTAQVTGVALRASRPQITNLGLTYRLTNPFLAPLWAVVPAFAGLRWHPGAGVSTVRVWKLLAPRPANALSLGGTVGFHAVLLAGEATVELSDVPLTVFDESVPGDQLLVGVGFSSTLQVAGSPAWRYFGDRPAALQTGRARWGGKNELLTEQYLETEDSAVEISDGWFLPLCVMI